MNGSNLSLILLLLLPPGYAAQTVASERKITQNQSGFGGILRQGDFFGDALGVLGDLDSDGVVDLAVGARGTNGGGFERGAVWILLLQPDGTVKGEQKIDGSNGGFTGALGNLDFFSSALAGLGDLDGDGVRDLASGAYGDDDGGADRGAVWVLFLNTDGTVSSHQKISATEGSFTGPLVNGDMFGFALAPLGDLDGDGVGDLAVGAPFDDDGGNNRGALWILFLNADGTVRAHAKISDTSGGFGGVLADGDQFGGALAALDDLDSDGVVDLAVGARFDDVGGQGTGAVWILFLDPDGSVRSHQRIGSGAGGFAGPIAGTHFGSALTSLGDLDGDGVSELVVGAENDAQSGIVKGAAWILLLRPDGTVELPLAIHERRGGFGGDLDLADFFGVAAAAPGDLDGDGVPDLLLGASGDDDAGNDAGAVWLLDLEPVRKIRRTPGAPPVVLPPLVHGLWLGAARHLRTIWSAPPRVAER